MNLRPYQQNLIDAARTELRRLNRTVAHRKPRLVMQLNCGGGKTITAAAMAKSALERGGRVAFLCHRDFLLDQASQTFTALGIDHSFIAAGRWFNPWTTCHIGMIGSMKSRMSRIKPPTLCFIDECFPAGTDVDGRPIESIKVGDLVSSVNHTTGVVERKKVTRLYRKKSRDLVVVKTQSREIICTPNHPFFCLGKGYVNASEIEGETVAVVHGLQHVVCCGQEPAPADEEPWKVLLLKGLLEGVLFKDLICDHGANEQGLRLRENEGKKSHGIGRSKGEDEGNPEEDKSQTNGPRRQREGSDNSPEGTCRPSYGSQSCDGIYLHNEGRTSISKPLQDRYSTSIGNDCDRGGWSLARIAGETSAGQEKGGTITFERVESVQVLKCGDYGGTSVFNIEIEGNNNYFANGVLVHNCHHIVANTWNAVLDAWPETTFILLSATPGMRTDRRGLDAIADGIVCGPSVSDLIQQGALSDYEWYAPTVPDLSHTHTRMGEYVTHEIDAEMSKSVIIGDIVRSYKKYADGALSVYFAQSIDTSRKYAQAFQDAGIPAMHMDANTPTDERKRIIRQAADGHIKVISNVMLFGEGFDVAAMAGRKDVTIEAVGLCRPTKSFPLLVQMAMRAMRAKETKGIILDHAGSHIEHQWLPDDEIEWTLEGGRQDDNRMKIMQCTNCGAALRRTTPVCHACGFANTLTREGHAIERAVPEHIDGELEKIERERARLAQQRERKDQQSQARTLEDLVELAKARGYSKPHAWAGHIWKARQKKRGWTT